VTPRSSGALERMAAAAAVGQASTSDVAYLTDRVLLREGKPQRYGTQFEIVDGTLVPKPMEDPASIDVRRREMGMDTMAQSAARMQAEYGMPALAVRPPREPGPALARLPRTSVAPELAGPPARRPRVTCLSTTPRRGRRVVRTDTCVHERGQLSATGYSDGYP
jgi:hypothetical protein